MRSLNVMGKADLAIITGIVLLVSILAATVLSASFTQSKNLYLRDCSEDGKARFDCLLEYEFDRRVEAWPKYVGSDFDKEGRGP